MVIIYDLSTKRILSTEDHTLVPAMPFGTEKEKRAILEKEGRGYVSIKEELGAKILEHELEFDDNDNFIGLVKK